jgi:hypothetical protein
LSVNYACLPDRQITEKPVQSALQKYFRSRLPQIKIISAAVSSHQEGRLAIVTDVGNEMQWTLMRRGRTAREADDEVVWS